MIFTGAGARIGTEDDTAVVGDADDGCPHGMRAVDLIFFV